MTFNESSPKFDLPLLTGLQIGAGHFVRARQSQEPVAKRGRSLGRVASVLRPDGNELLHGHVWSESRTRRLSLTRLGPRPRPAH